MVLKNPKVAGYYSIILFLLFIIIDRLTKIWALTLEKPLDLGFLEFVYTTNTGAGFSIFQNQNTLLAWVAVIALGVIIYYRESLPKLGFLMIISGLIGNLLDRVLYGYVIDFINFKVWPIFNVADSLIFIGVVVSIIYSAKKQNKPKSRKRYSKRRKQRI